MQRVYEPNNVLYVCTCGAKKPITKIYFCRHCSSLRCGECVSHEVDSHYCQTCLEYMPSPEARLKKNKCSNCFDCPSCMHPLSIRAGSNSQTQTSNPDDPTKSKKNYYLTCGFCRWTSRDVGMSDQGTASGGWQEAENPNAKRISQLMEFYRLLAQQEKLEKERKKMNQRYSYLHISDKYGMSTTVVRKLAGLPPAVSKEKPEGSEQLSLPEATTDVERLPESYLTEPLHLESVTTMKQRLYQPQFQPSLASELYPQNKYMHIKRSQRCKTCEHNLSKPEYNPASIKFKIQLAAFYHIPEMKVKHVSKLYLEKTCLVEMVLINPTPHPAHITFEPLEDPPENISPVKLPPGELVLAPRDDTAEFDDIGDTQQFKDDPNIVTFRKSNRLGFMFALTPTSKDVIVGFKMKHDFINMVVTLPGEQPREPQVVWLTHTLNIRLGTVIGDVS